MGGEHAVITTIWRGIGRSKCLFTGIFKKYIQKKAKGGGLILEDVEEPVSPGFSPDKLEMKSWDSHMYIQD